MRTIPGFCPVIVVVLCQVTPKCYEDVRGGSWLMERKVGGYSNGVEHAEAYVIGDEEGSDDRDFPPGIYYGLRYK